jgi:hypothetical protein
MLLLRSPVGLGEKRKVFPYSWKILSPRLEGLENIAAMSVRSWLESVNTESGNLMRFVSLKSFHTTSSSAVF